MRSLRVFFVGGLISYRALFGFLSLWIFVPTLILTPLFQIVLFAYIGRAAGTRNDEFYVIGNAIQYSSVPCLFAMTQTIAEERFWQTLGPILVSPAGRLPVFLGRAVPVIANGLFVAAFALFAGGLLLGATLDASAWARLAPVLVVGAFSCTGLGLVNAGIGLRVRETAVLSNVFVGILLIFCGANVALSSLPGWMADIGRALPLTHAIAAARAVAGGAPLGSVEGLLGREAAIGVAYGIVGVGLLAYFERQSRLHATLERV
jgi:ABC-2 type transport system permease protein